MTNEQGIIFMGVFWLIFALFNLGSLRLLDKRYKVEYLLTNTYKLNKTKYIFSYYCRKNGEIAKYVFWLNIAWYILSVGFLSLWVTFIIMQTKPWKLSSAILFFSHFALSVVIAVFGGHFVEKCGKKAK